MSEFESGYLIFKDYVEEREKKFVDLYTSIILHYQMTGHSGLLHGLQEANTLAPDGLLNHEYINRCVEVLDENYSVKDIKNHLGMILDSIVSILALENFEFFKENFPENVETISKISIHKNTFEEIRKDFNDLFFEFSSKLSILVEIDNVIQGLLAAVYSKRRFEEYGNKKSTIVIPSKKKRQLGVVGVAVFMKSGTTLGDIFGGSKMSASQENGESQKYFESIMEQISNYVNLCDELHQMLIHKSVAIREFFEGISRRLVKLELELYQKLKNETIMVDRLFEAYYETEIIKLEETYRMPVKKSDLNYTFENVVEEVNEIIAEYGLYDSIQKSSSVRQRRAA